MQAQHLQDELNELSSGENGHLSKLDTDDGQDEGDRSTFYKLVGNRTSLSL